MMYSNRMPFIVLALLLTTWALAGCAGSRDRVAAAEVTSAAAITTADQPTASPSAALSLPVARYEPPALPTTTLTDWEGTPYDDNAASDAASLLQSSALVVVAKLMGPDHVYDRPNTGWGYTSFTFSVEQVLKGNCYDAQLSVLSPLTPQQFADAYNGYVDTGALSNEMSVYTTLFPLPEGQRVLLMLQNVDSPLGGQAWVCNGLRSTVLLVSDDGTLRPSDWVDAGGSYRPDPELHNLSDAMALLEQPLPGAIPNPGDASAGIYAGSVVYWRDAKAAFMQDGQLAQYPQIRTVGSFAELTAAVQADPGVAIWIDYTLASEAQAKWFARKPQRTLPVVLMGCYDSGYGFTKVLPIEQQFHEVGIWTTYTDEPLGKGFSAFRCVAETPELEDPVRIQMATGNLTVEEILRTLQSMPLASVPEKGSDAYYIDIAAHAAGLDFQADRQLDGNQSPYVLHQDSGNGDGFTWTIRVIPYASLAWIPPAMGSPKDATIMVSILEDNQFQGMHKLTAYQVSIDPSRKVDSVSPYANALTHQDFMKLSDEELAAAQVLSQIVPDRTMPLSGSETTSSMGMNAQNQDVLLNTTLSTQVTPLGNGRYRVVFTHREDVLAEPATYADQERYAEKPEDFSVLRTLTSTWEYELTDGKAEAVRISVKRLNGLFDVEWQR